VIGITTTHEASELLATGATTTAATVAEALELLGPRSRG
jgi:hypothetical protein